MRCKATNKEFVPCLYMARPARANSFWATASEGLVLIPAINKNSTTGYKNVTYDRKQRGLKKFKAQAKDGGKHVFLGSFNTAEEAAVAYARSEYGRADAAKLLQPRPAPTAAGAEAIRRAEREGLTLAASSNISGYKNVTFKPKERSSKKYKLSVTVGSKNVHLGYFATAEQAALFYARREAGRDTSDLTAPPPPPPPPAPSTEAGARAVRQAKREGLELASSSSSTGYKGVCYLPKERGSKKYKLQVRDGGKLIFLGNFATAEQAALFYARREAGRDTSDLTAPPPPPPPPPEPSSAAGAEQAARAEREGLTLATSSSSNSGYRGVSFCPKRRGSKKYELKMKVGGKSVFLGWFATAEEAALARARHLWDTTVRLLEPQQAPPQGAAGPSEASYEEEEEGGFDPVDIATATALSLLSDPPPSTSEQRAARRQARAAEQAARAARAAAAAAAAAALAVEGAAPPCDDEVEVEAEVESDSEEEMEVEVEAAAAVAGVSEAAAEGGPRVRHLPGRPQIAPRSAPAASRPERLGRHALLQEPLPLPLSAHFGSTTTARSRQAAGWSRSTRHLCPAAEASCRSRHRAC